MSIRRTNTPASSVNIIYDGNFSNPVPVGVPKIKYPLANETSFYFVSQEYVQQAYSYQHPSFSRTHHIYNQANFCEERGLQDLGGGLVKYTWIFCKTASGIEESVQEAVTFPGMKHRRITYSTSQTIIVLDPESGNYIPKQVTESSYDFNIPIREPFTKRVQCIRQTRYVNIYQGGQESILLLEKNAIGPVIRYGGSLGSTSFDDADNLIIQIGDSSITVNKNLDNKYAIPQVSTGQSGFKEDSVSIQYPLEYTVPSAIEFLYEVQERQQNSESTSNYPSSPIKVSVPTNYISEISSPNLDQYINLVESGARMLVKPTEVQQISGTVYRVSETYTKYL